MSKAQEQANGRRSRSRRNRRFEDRDWNRAEALLREDWSPEQVAGSLRKSGDLSISHETIYRYVWADRAQGGDVDQHLHISGRGTHEVSFFGAPARFSEGSFPARCPDRLPGDPRHGAAGQWFNFFDFWEAGPPRAGVARDEAPPSEARRHLRCQQPR